MGIFKKLHTSENREVYYIDYYDENGVRKRECTGSGSHTFAKELLIKRKDEVAQRRKIPERYIPEVRFSDFIDNEYLPIHAKSLKTERAFINQYDHKALRTSGKLFQKGGDQED